MKKLKIYQIDSFTTEKFKGNPAGVVLNADGLTEKEMQNIARELNNSETAFLFKPDEKGCNLKIKYFTPSTEVPICGHATIAAHYALAIEKKLNSCTMMTKTGIGILPVEIKKNKNDYSIIMTQGKIEFFKPFSKKICNEILKALKLKDEDRDTRCPIQIVSTGHSKVMIGIKSKKILDKLEPNMEILTEISKKIGCNGYFVFTLDSTIKNVYTHGRMFAPAIGILEDPVTGNANGPLGAYLVEYNLINHDGIMAKFNAEQGSAIKRSGIVSVQVKIEEGRAKQIKISGKAVVVMKSTCIL